MLKVRGILDDYGFGVAWKGVEIESLLEGDIVREKSLILEVPGAGREDVSVEVLGSGERKLLKVDVTGGRKRVSRTYTLSSEVNLEKIDAEVKNGILTISLPKKEGTSRRVEVK